MGFWSSTQKAGGVVPKTDWLPIHQSVRSDAMHFLDCLEQERESDVPATVGAHAVEVIAAAYRASAAGATVQLTNAS